MICRLIIKEIWHRKFNFILSLLAVVVAVGFFVSSITTGQASHRETVRIMRGTGLNLRIIPAKTNMDNFWLNRYSQYTMPENYIKKIAHQKTFTANHLIATLTRKITFKGQKILLTGIAPQEICPPGHAQSHMVATVPLGTVDVGYTIAKRFNLHKGDTIEIMGKKLRVHNTLHETGTPAGDDIRIYCHLADAQNILGLTGKINEIKALDCMCLAARKETRAQTLQRLRKALKGVLPNVEVFLWKDISDIRHEQRIMIRRYVYSIILPSVIVVCIVWIGLLAMLNVRQRRTETGILRALGYNSAQVAGLFIGKAFIIGIIGAVLGFALGTYMAMKFGPSVFTETAKSIKPEYVLLLWSVIVAPLMAAMASLVPATVAVTQDPAGILNQQ